MRNASRGLAATTKWQPVCLRRPEGWLLLVLGAVSQVRRPAAYNHQRTVPWPGSNGQTYHAAVWTRCDAWYWPRSGQHWWHIRMESRQFTDRSFLQILLLVFLRFHRWTYRHDWCWLDMRTTKRKNRRLHQMYPGQRRENQPRAVQDLFLFYWSQPFYERFGIWPSADSFALRHSWQQGTPLCPAARVAQLWRWTSCQFFLCDLVATVHHSSATEIPYSYPSQRTLGTVWLQPDR